MKILFLHLSDIHIDTTNKDTILERIPYINNALSSIDHFDQCCVIISGDIAMSSTPVQYSYAKSIIKYLYKLIKERFENRIVRIVIVPGNHDVDLSVEDLGRSYYDRIFKSNEMASLLPNEVAKQSNFFAFSETFYCFSTDGKRLLDKKIYRFIDFSMEINLLNSALYSTKESDKGNHFLPESVINQLQNGTNSDFTISVMHHPIEWFCYSTKTHLERAIIKNSSFIFLGHEHESTTKNIDYFENGDSIYFVGGCFFDPDNINRSDFSCTIYDTVTSQFTFIEMVLDSTNKQYEPHILIERTLIKKSEQNHCFQVKLEQQKKILTCDADPINAKLFDYFVFPRLSFIDADIKAPTPDIKDFEAFLSLLQVKPFITVAGDYKQGKTALLRYLFYNFCKTKTVILVTGQDFSQKMYKNLIREKFEEFYSDDPASFLRFRQMDKNNKVILIDNFEDIKQEVLYELLENLKDDFGVIISALQDSIGIDIFDKLVGSIRNYGDFTRLKIEPIYADKRKDLISNIINIERPHSDNKLIVDALCTGLSSQRYLTCLDPEFVIKYSLHFCSRTNDIIENDATMFSKVFEANLTLAIQSVNKFSSKLSIDKVFFLISEIAYQTHKAQLYPIPELCISKTILKYNEYSGDDVSIRSILDIMCRSKIMYQIDSTNYEFSNYSYYTYFVAKAIVKLLHSHGQITDIQELIDFSYYKVDADILMFITYLTDSAIVINQLIESELQTTQDWPQYSVTNNNLKYLETSSFRILTAPDEADIKNNEEVRVAEEKIDELNRSNSRHKNIYEQRNGKRDPELDCFKRSVFLLNIISRSLPTFEHNLSKLQKKEIVKSIYTLPNKIFYMITSNMDSNLPHIIEILKSIPASSFKTSEPLTEEFIVKKLQDISIILLLDLYNLANSHCVKPNTIKFLENNEYFDHFADLSYRLQHLMMLISSRRCRDFSTEIVRVNKFSVKAHQKSLLQRISYNFLIECAGIAERSDLQQVKDTVFHLTQDEEMRLLSAQRKEMSKYSRF